VSAAEESEEEPRPPSQEERMRSHLEERFRRMGFNELQVEVLIDKRIDTHTVEDLISKGCDPPVAFDIVT
jgi:hypothetical protein